MANTRLSDLLQILVYLKVHEGEKLPSTIIAASLNTNPSLVRQMISQLSKAEILKTQRGSTQIDFCRPLDEITALDVYRASAPTHNLLVVDHNTSQTCTVGVAFPNVLAVHFDQLQREIEAKLAKITIAQLVEETQADIAQHAKIDKDE
ncbi:MAG TPA: Rrf2 family transcriptional regulator [Candidatus Limosilactobacillus faecipullorum]|nr:Rrf2 family transcriptional regulator [Candidatus Limosilactobacillus faecipullorum]